MWAQNDAMQIPGRDWVGGRGGYGGPQAPPMQAMPMPAQAPPMPPPMQAMPSAPTQSGPMPQQNIGEILQRMFNKPALMDQPAPPQWAINNGPMRDMGFRPWDPSRPEFDPNYKMPDFKSVMFPGAEIGPSGMASDEYKNSQAEMIENLKKQYQEKPLRGASGGWGGADGGPTGMQMGRGQGAPPIDPRFLQMIQGMMQQRGGGMQAKPMPMQAPQQSPGGGQTLGGGPESIWRGMSPGSGGNQPIGMTGWYGPGGQGNPIYGGGYGGMSPGGWGGMTGQNPQARNVLGGWRQQMNRSDIGNLNEGMGSPLFAQIMALKAAQGGR